MYVVQILALVLQVIPKGLTTNIGIASNIVDGNRQYI